MDWRMRARRAIRIVGAIAAKDVIDAIKNRTTLSLALAMVMMMLGAQALPFLVSLSATPRLVIYDEGTSGLAERLREAGYYQVSEVDSLQALEASLAQTVSPVLGLAIPDGLSLASGQAAPVVEGYVAWSVRGRASELEADAGAQLGELLSRPVDVRVDGRWVYPVAGDSGTQGMVVTTWVIVLATIGAFLVPYLLFEERQTHTMDVLLVSPASGAEIVGGKALAGLFYCGVAMAVAFAFQRTAVVQWWIALAVAACGALLTIAVGLVLGSLFENAQQMSLWVALPFLILLVPVVLVTMGGPLSGVPATVLSWTPTAALADGFRLAFVPGSTVGTALAKLAVVLAWAVPVYGAVVWIVRRSRAQR